MNWITDNIVEIIGTISGLIYLYLEIKQNKWLWPVGLLTSVMYIYVFFVAKLYADMSLQFYYVFISIYGWILWSRGKSKEDELPVTRLQLKLSLKLAAASLAIYAFIAYILVNYTDDTVPYWDAFTTAFSVIATWMLARKILEQWLVWIVVNSVSLGIYIYKDLNFTAILFFFYTTMAVVGYMQWKKDMIRSQAISGN
ncbi:nicotinamide riboside transporter PnuC [Marinifilum caeruleilacunae]|uniref:Nicotinamide riboside transporter PnuC n=1 Tax=Marinifilum caeruleilacunae TaxID=2499076 RepID=A0ABX1WZP3_9BACT|nr:nicotinamide riboside transporter PnuC [Marinifilum caeruleilacunae]NOU61343.1 nicotinamide riboside transporter PnuC [Marinifilum caeruleilacunae]